MKKIAVRSFAISLSVLMASACSFSNDALFPSLFGSSEQEATASSKDSMPNLGTTNFEVPSISKGSSTGTFVGQKVESFRKDLGQVQASVRSHNEELQSVRNAIISNAVQYHNTTAAMEAKLQVGTTPGNPHMLGMLQSAQNNVQAMNASSNALNQLSAKTNSDSTMVANLLDSIRSSYAISGAVDEDHTQLRILENEANQTLVVVNSLSNEIQSDASRQQQYIDTARANLAQLEVATQNGSYSGSSNYYPSNNIYNAPVSNRPYNLTPLVNNAPMAVSGSPLMTVKFNKSNVSYKDALRAAVGSANGKKPNAQFTVVGVSPTGADQSLARNKAGQIFQDITGMGVSADRINITSKTASVKSPEVQIFVR